MANKRTTARRVLTLILAFVMLFSVMQMSAFAAQNDKVYHIDLAVKLKAVASINGKQENVEYSLKKADLNS